MSVAEETSQDERGWLKECAPQNMAVMSVTEETSQAERGRSKAVALKNIKSMLRSPRRRPMMRGAGRRRCAPQNMPYHG